MKKTLILLLSLVICTFSFAKDEYITEKSKFSPEKTVQILEKAIKSKKLTVFTEIDHQQAAKKAGLQMNFETLIIFGNPKMGTVLMKKNPVLGLELPLKILVWEDNNHNTFVSYKNPEWIKDKLPAKMSEKVYKKMNGLYNYLISNIK